MKDPLHIEAAAGSVLLLGRAPDPSRLPPGLCAGVLRPVTVPSWRVSANHALLCCDDEGAWLQDLHSRNGTSLRLRPHEPVRLPGARQVRLDLAPPPAGAASGDGIAAAEWDAPGDFAPAVAAAVQRWLAAQDLDATVRLRGPRGGGDDPALWLLADGSRLQVQLPADATLAGGWSAILDRVSAYVHGQNLRFTQEEGLEDDLVMASPRLRQAHAEVVEAAAFGVRLMLLGPTGAGKDRLARRYHRCSPRRDGPFVSVNCALLREDLLYAQLFGARRGSFTGATTDLVGDLEAAHGGTLFLDELAEMDLKVQGALLRFLDARGEYSRLGESKKRHADVQLLCATNAALDDPATRQGRFRDDLWYRLAVRVVQVPPLRDRPEDVVTCLLRWRLRGGGLSAHEALSPEALELVLSDPWPGNFRDLENFLARLPPCAQPQGIDAATCRAALSRGGREVRGAAPPPTPPPGGQGAFGVAGEQALSAFIADHGAPPRDWGELQRYTEKYLKPVFVAHSLGLAGIDVVSRDLNLSDLARRLHVADGTTVKQHLRRYVERFRGGGGDGGS